MSKDDEYWVLCIEKAVAKAFGSYEMIEGGKPYQAFSWLTGFPSHCIFHEGLAPMEVWQHILKAVSDDHPLVGSINSSYQAEKTSNSEYSEKGLTDHHCYAILDAIDIMENAED